MQDRRGKEHIRNYQFTIQTYHLPVNLIILIFFLVKLIIQLSENCINPKFYFLSYFEKYSVFVQHIHDPFYNSFTDGRKSRRGVAYQELYRDGLYIASVC